MSSEEIFMAEAHKGREVIYASLARFFIDLPSEELFQRLKTILPNIAYMAEDCEERLIKEGYEGLKKFVEKRSALSGKELSSFDEDWLRHFTRVFCLTDSVPISESVYTSPEHLSMQEASTEVNKLYKACSFDIKLNDSNEPPDHISYELMFMAYLARGTWEHIEKGNKENAESLLNLQHSFISDHIFKWINSFLQATIRFPESIDFYAPVTYFMLGYIKEDASFLS